jgi:hypothetical protein
MKMIAALRRSGFSRELPARNPVDAPVLSFPFKGKAGMGMGFVRRIANPIPTPTLPLKGREP